MEVDQSELTTSLGYQPQGMAVMVVVASLLVMASLVSVGILVAPVLVNPSNQGQPISYYEAMSSADLADRAAPGGPWQPTTVLGLGSNFSLRTQASQFAGLIPGCTSVWSGVGLVIFASTPKGAQSGSVSSWTIFSANSTGAMLETIVSNVGELASVPVAIYTGACTQNLTSPGSIPSNVIDSPLAVNITDANGGEAFLRTYPNPTVELQLQRTHWLITYTTCSFPQATGQGDFFNATLNSTTGHVYSAGTLTDQSCGGV